MLREKISKSEPERNSSPINQWVRLNRLLATYKYALIVQSAAILGFLVLTIVLINRDTLVIGITPNEKLFFVGERRSPNIAEADVTEFSKLYIRTRYSWDSFRLDNLLKELSPITSAGLLQKIGADLSKNKALIAQSSLAQDVIIRNVKLDNSQVLALIDRVIQVNEKMKVVSPLELTITLIRGKTNRYNPLGLYVNSVIEHDVE